MNSRRIIAVIRWALSFLLLGGIVLVYHRWIHVNPTTLALTLLLFILAVAARWSLRLAVALSVAATFAYNFFFLPPFGTLTIADPQNWIALIALLSTSVVGSRLSERARREAEDARTREREMETLFQLSQQLLRTEDVAELINEIPAVVISATGARSCVLYLLDGDQLLRAGERTAQMDLSYLRERATAATGVSREGEDLQIALHVGVKPRGLMVLSGDHLSTDAAEAMAGLISVSIDRVRALETVAHNEANRESERLRTLMIDSITHELRTPLTSIKGAATTLLSDPGVDQATRKELLSIVDEECDRIDHLVGQAAEMAQLDSLQVQMHFENVAVADLLESALDACCWITNEYSVKLQQAPDVNVHADREYITRVLCNLLENAARYSPKGTEIQISAESDSGTVAIHVADHGSGIDPSEQAMIFDRFYRSPEHTQRIPGTGMGLSISKAIVERHGGTISLVSQPGAGSVFTVSLPVQPHQ